MKNIIIIIAFILLTAFTGWNYYRTPKIVFVRSSILVEKYNGTDVARKKYQDQLEKWKSNIDTLKFDYNRRFTNFSVVASSLSKSEREKQQRELDSERKRIEEYIASLQQKAQADEEELVQKNLNEINAFVEEYSKQKGYDVVLGTTVNGNIMYGQDSYDVTNEILEKLNERYLKGK